MLRYVLLLPLLGALACAAPDAPEAAPAPELTGLWDVTHIAGEPVIEGSPCSIEFADDGRVSGSGSVNRFSGSFDLAGDALSFTPLAATKRAGPVPLMNQEQALFTALGEVAIAARDGDTLRLLAVDGRELVVAVRGKA